MIKNNKITLLGDLSLSGSFVFDSKNNTKRFETISKYLSNSNLVIANLETPVINSTSINLQKKQKSGVILGTSSDVLRDSLISLNVKFVTLANNHIGDYGYEGFKKTIAELEALDVKYTGAGTNTDGIKPLEIKFKNQIVSLISYIHSSTNPHFCDDRILINFYKKDKILEDIKYCKSKYNKCILSIHWGKDWSYYPQKYQKEDARDFVEAGADFIFGHHPHTFQVFETIRSKPVFYSVGDFCHGNYYNSNNELISYPIKSSQSAILEYDIFTSDIKIVPLRIDRNGKIELCSRNITKINLYRTKIMFLIHKSSFWKYVFDIKEGFVDRIYDFLFGYNRNFIIQILKIFNPMKLFKLLNELQMRFKIN